MGLRYSPPHQENEGLSLQMLKEILKSSKYDIFVYLYLPPQELGLCLWVRLKRAS